MAGHSQQELQRQGTHPLKTDCTKTEVSYSIHVHVYVGNFFFGRVVTGLVLCCVALSLFLSEYMNIALHICCV